MIWLSRWVNRPCGQWSHLYADDIVSEVTYTVSSLTLNLAYSTLTIFCSTCFGSISTSGASRRAWLTPSFCESAHSSLTSSTDYWTIKVYHTMWSSVICRG